MNTQLNLLLTNVSYLSQIYNLNSWPNWGDKTNLVEVVCYCKRISGSLIFLSLSLSHIMECLMGLACRDFVMLAADMTKTQSILVMKSDEEKLFKLTDTMLMAVCGDSGDTSQFSEFIAKNIQLYKMRNGYSLSPSAASNFTRRNLADYLRSRTPYNVNVLLGGYDSSKNEFELYFCDYLASLVKIPFAVHGFGGHFCLSIMDHFHRNDLTIEEGYEIIKKCVTEIHKRVVINLPNFNVRVITRYGISNLEAITSAKLATEYD